MVTDVVNRDRFFDASEKIADLPFHTRRPETAASTQHYAQLLRNVIVVQTGEGTLVYGGEMVDGKTTAPNEIRGPRIAGGTEKPLMPGDVVEMPAKVPHWVKVAPGKQITYLVIKVTQ